MSPVAEIPTEALDLRETSVTTLIEGDSPIQEDGTVLLHIIRPGLGRGKGRHLYEAKMLEENATKFAGWRQYINHLSPEAKKAAGGLPRDVRDLGGRIVESWWDGSVPPSDRFGQGAVVARAKPTPFMRELIENDPEIVEASISATATGVKRGEHSGAPCWIVEGIEDRGSVDWVTEAGAGGRVVSLMEAAFEHDQEGRVALLASMTDEEFARYVEEERPELAEGFKKGGHQAFPHSASGGTGGTAPPPPGDRTTGGQAPPQSIHMKRAKHADKLVKKGMPRKLADKAAAKAIQESEEDDMPITKEALQEALSDEDTRTALLEALDIESYVEEKATEIAGSIVGERLPQLVEAQVEAERDFIRATARADADRRVQIERMRSKAHGMIRETTLPDAFKATLRAKFDLSETGDPTPDLNVVDKIDGEGKVEKKAEDVLAEKVKDAIQEAVTLYGAANPARVRGQGGQATGEDGGEPPKSGVAPGSLTESLLAESGFDEDARKNLYEAV